jgi:adenine-specific DNA-methyltransferase
VERKRGQLLKKISSQESELVEELNALRSAGEIDWRIQFAEVFAYKKGFDLVLGNPPYLSARRITTDKSRLAKLYNSAYGSYDIYVLFFERGLQLLNPSGYQCLITSNKFLIADYGKALRELLRRNTRIHFIVDLAAFKGSWTSTHRYYGLRLLGARSAH